MELKKKGKRNQTYTQIYMETNTNMYRNIYKYV